jgi:hypothetical protein
MSSSGRVGVDTPGVPAASASMHFPPMNAAPSTWRLVPQGARRGSVQVGEEFRAKPGHPGCATPRVQTSCSNIQGNCEEHTAVRPRPARGRSRPRPRASRVRSRRAAPAGLRRWIDRRPRRGGPHRALDHRPDRRALRDRRHDDHGRVGTLPRHARGRPLPRDLQRPAERLRRVEASRQRDLPVGLLVGRGTLLLRPPRLPRWPLVPGARDDLPALPDGQAEGSDHVDLPGCAPSRPQRGLRR